MRQMMSGIVAAGLKFITSLRAIGANVVRNGARRHQALPETLP